MILAKNNNKIGHIEGIWPICYRTTSQFFQAGSICPNKNAMQNRMSVNRPIYLWPSLPVPTVTVQTSTALMQTIFRSLNGWEKPKPSDGYTVKPATHDSASNKAHLCNIRSCRKPMLSRFAKTCVNAAVKKGQRQTQESSSQTTFGFAGGCSKETSRPPGQFVEGIEQGVVWQKEGNRKAYSKAGHWSQDQYFSYGTTQRHNKRTTSSLDKTYSQRLSSGRCAATFDMAVAGLVQPDKGVLLVAERNACDGVGSGRGSMDCFEICFVSGSCQRPSVSGIG